MLDWLILLTNKKICYMHSWLVKQVLRLKGIKVGKGFYIEGVPKLKINGRAANISIGNNVRICGPIDIRNRENGKVIIADNVYFDTNVRLVAAQEGVLKIGAGSSIGPYTVFNAGANIEIGESALISGFVSMNASDHQKAKGKTVLSQGYHHKPIVIGNDVWIGIHCVILPGITIGDGAVVAANAVVTKNIESNKIGGGVPAKVISERQ